MMQYSKIIAGILGGVLGLAIQTGVDVPAAAMAPELQAGAVSILSMLAVYFAPANKGKG